MSALLLSALESAVPLHILTLQELPFDEIIKRAREAGQVIASHGDDIQFRAKKGQTADAFNKLAEGLACLAFVPGGVTFMGIHWEAKHAGPPQCRLTKGSVPLQNSGSAKSLHSD